MNNWDGYKPSPIEVFHGEAMKDFHAGAEFKTNEILVERPVGMTTRYINGIEFNRLLAKFKVKIMDEYGISNNAIKVVKND